MFKYVAKFIKFDLQKQKVFNFNTVLNKQTLEVLLDLHFEHLCFQYVDPNSIYILNAITSVFLWIWEATILYFPIDLLVRYSSL